MAMTETTTQAHDREERPGRRRPFSTLMKKLVGLKAASSSSSSGDVANAKRNQTKKRQGKNNNPYPCSGTVNYAEPRNSHYTVSTGRSARSSSVTSLGRSESPRLSTDGLPPPTTGGRSMAPTISTDHETYTSRSIAVSHGASSLAGTSRTANGMESRRGGDSTFSSPAPSVRSLTTTLTTIQSLAPNGMGGTQNYSSTSNHVHQNQSNSQIIHFDQPFPTASPASAIPVHLAPAGSTTGHPTTYATATANNLLTDNASILTLASSSKRRRRRSFDTDASVRALAPSSLFGGSRESLPLSILSANMNMDAIPAASGSAGPGGPTTPGLHRGTSGMANERTSIYSATGILAGTAASERNSFYAKPQTLPAGSGDAASIRSGLLGHGYADSVGGGIQGGGVGMVVTTSSPLASPREVSASSAMSPVSPAIAEKATDTKFSDHDVDGKN